MTSHLFMNKADLIDELLTIYKGYYRNKPILTRQSISIYLKVRGVSAFQYIAESIWFYIYVVHVALIF